MSQTSITVDDAEVRAALREFARRGGDGRKPLLQFFHWWGREVDKQWGRIKTGGGNFRGKRWPAMSPLYRRKSGTSVPAWGGVPKIRGKGMVKARKRPSGQRLKIDDVMMKDTGNMRNSILVQPMQLTKTKLTVGSAGLSKNYGDALQKKRPVVFWARGDEKKFNAYIRSFYDRLVERFNR